jgi:hypothetical protein
VTRASDAAAVRRAEVARLRVDHGLSFAEIAERFGITKTNATRLYYAYVAIVANNPPLPPLPGSIDELDLTPLTLSRLHRAGVHTVEDLESRCVETRYKGQPRGIVLVRGMGVKTEEAIYRAIRRYRDGR